MLLLLSLEWCSKGTLRLDGFWSHQRLSTNEELAGGRAVDAADECLHGALCLLSPSQQRWSWGSGGRIPAEPLLEEGEADGCCDFPDLGGAVM